MCNTTATFLFLFVFFFFLKHEHHTEKRILSGGAGPLAGWLIVIETLCQCYVSVIAILCQCYVQPYANVMSNLMPMLCHSARIETPRNRSERVCAFRLGLLRETRLCGARAGNSRLKPVIGVILLAIGAPRAPASALPPRRGRRLEWRDARRDAAVRLVRDIRAWESCLSRLAVSVRVAISCDSYVSPRNYYFGPNHGPREMRVGHHVLSSGACCCLPCAHEVWPLPSAPPALAGVV